MSKVSLPTRFYRARTVRIQSINCIEFQLDLNFGVSVKKHVVLEAVEKGEIPSRLRSDAMHVLVVLLGGKSALVQLEDDPGTDGYIRGRVYLDAGSERVDLSVPGVEMPVGVDVPMLEVSTFYKHVVKDMGADVDYVKKVLNGARN